MRQIIALKRIQSNLKKIKDKENENVTLSEQLHFQMDQNKVLETHLNNFNSMLNGMQEVIDTILK